MKTYSYIASTFMMLAALSSCVMIDELKGNSAEMIENADSGRLNVEVSIKEPVAITRSVTQVTDFPVTIKGADANLSDIVKEYASSNAVPSGLTLPVGNYTVTAHTPGELQKQMSTPYYSGSLNLLISKDITVEANVICKMANSRIQLVYGEDFLAAFKSWTITVDDGSDSAISYDETDKKPASVYRAFEENTVTTITVNISAITKSGNTINETRSFRKSDAIEKYDDVSEYFCGGDAICINLGATESTTGSLGGITINASISFEDYEEFVEIPVGGGETVGPDTPSTDGDKPSLTCVGKKTNSADVQEGNIFETGVEYSIENENWPVTDVVISTPAGLKSLKVTIVGGNEGFDGICEELEFTDRELVGDTELPAILGGLGVSLPMPQANATSYTFPIGTFYAMMNLYGPTVDSDQTDFDPDGKECHTFSIVVEDNAGNKVSGSLSVTIKK